MGWITSQIETWKKWAHDEEGEPLWQRWMGSAAVAVLVALFIIAIGQFLFVSLFGSTPNEDTLTRFGISGDYFGFANAVFSALAFAMLIVTLWMQKHELSLQREEIKNTQEELKGQKLEMKQQNESLRRQTFENTFFGMLSLHGAVVSEIAPEGSGKKGREALWDLASSLDPSSAMFAADHNEEIRTRSVSKRLEDYEKWYDDNEHHVGHYFRTLYNLIRYVDEHAPSERERYTRLIRAQLSRGELEILLHNGLSKHGRVKFKPLIEDYALLKHVKKTDGNRAVRGKYAPTAFGTRKDTESA